MGNTVSPLVSVITPTYNRAHTLPRLWKSLQSQTFKRFEWVVVDDGSQDDTAQLVRQWQEHDERVVYYSHETNQGVNAARATGVGCARAPLLLFLDSDDMLYEEQTLQLMYSEISQSPERVGAVCFSVVRSDGKPLSYVAQDKISLTYEEIVCGDKARGEFVEICRRGFIECAPWSPYRGLEVVHHWARARHFDIMFVRRVGRIVYSDAGNQLTSARSVLSRAEEMYEGLQYLLSQHGETMQKACPRRLHEYYFYISMYAALIGKERSALRFAWRALRGGAYPLKSSVVLLSCLLPLEVRRKLFVLRAQLREG